MKNSLMKICLVSLLFIPAFSYAQTNLSTVSCPSYDVIKGNTAILDNDVDTYPDEGYYTIYSSNSFSDSEDVNGI